MSIYSFLFLVIIFFLFLVRGIRTLHKGKDYNFLFVSFFLISIPFEISKTLLSADKETLFGTLGSELRINIYNFIALVFIFINRKMSLNGFIKIPFFRWLFLLIIFSLISPINQGVFGSFVFFYFILSLTLLFTLFTNYLTLKQIFIGIFDGLMILIVLQFILSMCFPVLNISFVTKIFHESAEYWSTRGGGRVGAVGFFKHPGNLGVFVTLASSFFLACYLRKFKKSISLILFGMSIIIIFLTFSRTSYVTFIVTCSIMFFYHIYSQQRKINLLNLLKITLPIAIIVYWIIFLSPFADTFLKSDAEDQIDNRFLHYTMGERIFLKSPIFGVGLNSHLSFINRNYDIQSLDLTPYAFFISNPIHNIHLIILAETGLIGLFLWFFFIKSSFAHARFLMYEHKYQTFALSFVGILVGYCLYGFTGWAPLSYSILPYFLFFVWVFSTCYIKATRVN